MNSQSQPLDSLSEKAKDRLNKILPGFSAYGFNLKGMSANSNILMANKSGIILKYSDETYYLFATYDLDLKALSPNFLNNALEKVKVMFIRHSLQGEDRSASWHKIPDWVTNFKNIECLILDNVDLQNESMLKELKLKFLGILSAKIKNTQPFIQIISKISSLEFLMYKSLFSSKDIEELKKVMPQLTTFQSIL